MIAFIARLLLPLLGVAAVVLIPSLGFQVVALRAKNATLSADLAAARADLALSRANANRLKAGIDAQNAGIDQHRAEGEAALRATEERLQAFPDVGLPPSFTAPLTGSTACERAEEVRGRLLDAIGGE